MRIVLILETMPWMNDLLAVLEAARAVADELPMNVPYGQHEITLSITEVRVEAGKVDSANG